MPFVSPHRGGPGGCPSPARKKPISPALSSPFRNFTFSNYPNLKKIIKNLANCGVNYLTIYNPRTDETKTFPLYCDNRICLHPDCQKHRLYKYMDAHQAQIFKLSQDMKSPKAWIFTTPRKPYPIDREYCRKRLLKLNQLLDKSSHPKFGSNSLYSSHMEIKLHADSWYLHFHVVSGGLTNLRFIRQRWGYQIKYEDAISPRDLGYYVSKYASKVPSVPNHRAYIEYANAVYKLQMHRFSINPPPYNPELAEWIIIDRKTHRCHMTYGEMESYIDSYISKHLAA
jgi:hypothetical protein